MKKYGKNHEGSQDEIDQLRELRGNSIRLEVPITNKQKMQHRHDVDQQHMLHKYGNQTGEFETKYLNNLQRSSQNYENQSEEELNQMQQSPRQQQHDYVNKHGGGLIPPANFTENPFTSYLKSIGATVSNVQDLNKNMEVSLLKQSSTSRAQNKQVSIKNSQESFNEEANQKSRNQERKIAASLQPVGKQTSNTFGESSETGLSRINIKDKLSRNETQTLERSSYQSNRKINKQIDILTANLDANEIRALRVANPLHQAFNSHLSKVINSVQQRRRGVAGYMLDQDSQILALQDISHQKNELNLNKSETEAFRNQQQLNMSMEESQSAHTEVMPYILNTPARVRIEARRELALLNKQKEQQVKPFSMFKQQVQDGFVPQQRAVDQVANLLNRVNKNKDQVIIPLEVEINPNLGGIAFKDAKNLQEVHNGQIVFSKGGFLNIASNKNQQTEFISKEQYIQDGVQQMVLNQVPFFRKFLALKTFKLWKYTMQRNVYNRHREKLAKNLIFSKPIFSSRYKELAETANVLRYINMIECKQGIQYGKHQTVMFDQKCAENCKYEEGILQSKLIKIQGILEQIRKQIVKDDTEFLQSCNEIEEKRIVTEKAHELILFSQARAAKQAEQKERVLMKLRQDQYNLLIQLVCRIIFQNLSELLLQNKQEFVDLFTAAKSTTQFEISLCLDNMGRLATSPTQSEHKDMFKKVFVQMEDILFKNYFLTTYFQDLVQMFFWEDKWTNPPGALLMRRQIVEIEELVRNHPNYLENDLKIENQLTQDLLKLDQQLVNYGDVEEVYEFTHDWNERRRRISLRSPSVVGQNGGESVSQEIEFYKTTWVKLEQLNHIIEKIPISHTKLGTIILETASLKKQLAEMPRQIVESIRTNVTQTIESETKALREELKTTTDTLDKLPITLNIYVDQVNTLKYLKEKQEEFKNKFNTIKVLEQQCKQDNIKISIKLQLSIEEVATLYKNQPQMIQKARDGLAENRNAIEQSMFKSSEGLSLKIKAFEKKYVETYLQDRTRLERCKETLDELQRRSQAIIEMKSKVILYKEFLKILYEDDVNASEKLSRRKLSCAEDCDFMEAIHKNTIKMWKIFLYWTKKRHMCLTTPYLEFDLNIIFKAISKVTKFLADQGKQSEVVAYKAQPVTRAVNSQVKETQVVVEFIKEMDKDTLKRRHWYQIFSLLKAPHLKNSTTFTIVDLRDNKIQNLGPEVRAIIEHANTESKYETVFTTIRDEWELSVLKIIPFKEQINDYIITNQELMADAIEDNLSTLDMIFKSPYAGHVSQDIEDLIQKLKSMLDHLLLWSQAQKYWLTLDPIYNSGLFKNIFEEHNQDFLDARSKFRRIMWSSYRRPKTTYNLMIKDRLPVFQKLIHFYAMIQKQVNTYLESKRLLFSRFYFLNDSQFLDMMMLSNSNQDFSVYINTLFQGVQKLFVTRLLQNSDLSKEQKSLAHQFEYDRQNNEEQEGDFETQLENFIINSRSKYKKISGANDPIIEELSDKFSDNQQQRSIDAKEILQKSYDFNNLDNILGKPVIQNQKPQISSGDNRNNQNKIKFENVGFAEQYQASDDEIQPDDRIQDQKSNRQDSIGFDGNSVLSQDRHRSIAPSEIENENYQIYKELIHQKQQVFENQQNVPAINYGTNDFIVLGLLSCNKELLLFDQHVSMSQPMEQWLSETELAMQDSLRKQMVDSIENFMSEPLEEWILDYPQQVVISTLHLILSQEINDILTNIDYDIQVPNSKGKDGPSAPLNQKLEGEDTLQLIGLQKESKKGFQEIAIQIGAKDPTEIKAEGDSGNLNGPPQARRPQKQDTKGEAARPQVIIRKRQTFEPELDQDEQQIQFVDECFGDEARIDEILDKAVEFMKQTESRTQTLAQKKNALNVRKPDYKEQILQVLSYKGLQSLYIRLQFWINKMMKLLYYSKSRSIEKTKCNVELPNIQKMRIKTTILFLKHQQEQVETFIQLRVSNVNDFEWQSKLRLVWSKVEFEAQVVCGGWSLNLGYEYLGSSQRLVITPLTQRYFVFMSSALRERQSVLLQCCVHETIGEEIVKEFASLCHIPFKSHYCTTSNNLSALTQLLNGGAMANTWIFFEHMDNLPLEKLQILIKEIQLLHEQFIVSGFSKNLLKEKLAKQQNIQLNAVSSTQILQNKNQIQTLGIFGSTTFRLQQVTNLKQTSNTKIFIEQIKSQFRIISLAKPNLEAVLKNLLFVEDFVEHQTGTQIFKTVLDKFFVLKANQFKENGQQSPLENQVVDSIEIPELRQLIKQACILRDLEFNAYLDKQIERQKRDQQSKSRVEKREIYVCKNDNNQWEIRKKLRETWIQERQAITTNYVANLAEKFKIEVDSLKEAGRQIFIRKFTPELLHYNHKVSSKITDKKNKQSNLNLKSLEDQVQQMFLKCFEQVVNDRKDVDTQIELQYNIRQKMLMDGEIRLEPDLKSSADVQQLSTSEKLQSAREKFQTARKDTLVGYKSKFDAYQTKQVSSQLRVCHGSTINLFYSQTRQQKEDKFQMAFTQGLKSVGAELNFELTNDQLYNCFGIVENMKRYKGIAIVGPVCSGKTQLLKIVSLTLKKFVNTVLRTSYINPNTFSKENLYGPMLAFDQNSIYQLDQPLQAQSIFQLILNNYSREKQLLSDSERDRLIQAIYIDEKSINNEILDSFKNFFFSTNLRERDYLSDQEFLVDFSTETQKVQPGQIQSIPIRFPNGNVTLFPSDLYIFFECLSLKDASPSFVTQIGIVYTQTDDVRYEHIFNSKLRQLQKKHEENLLIHNVHFDSISQCCIEFVTPFLKSLNKQPDLSEWRLWNMKFLTNQFFGLLDSQLYKLEDQATYQKQLDDDFYPLEETQRDALWNIVLTSVVWSFGAVLNRELRVIFDDQFGIYKNKFNISFATQTKQRFKLFDIFFDIQKLSWNVFTEKLEYKLKSYFEPSLQALLLPTVEISQAFFMIDNQVSYMKADKELNKSFRLIGPSSSSKTVILNTFASKVQVQTTLVSVPMSSYLTLELFKEKIEENYRKKREASMVPKDPKKQILLVIDDVHLQSNLQVELLEFIRSWCFSRGYYSIPINSFKKIADFGCIVAENFNFNANTKKNDRFLQETTTLYCEEISVDSFKLFIQSWLTSNQWAVSALISKFYLLISNSLMALIDKIKGSDNVINNFSYTSLQSFHFVAKFCANLVINSSITDTKLDIYGGSENMSRKEEEAVADLFCYEAMRTYGDRLMRPSSKQFFMEKLAQIVQKEFLCPDAYNSAYIEQLVLGNYHIKDENALHKYINIQKKYQRDEVCSLIRQKCKRLSGNSFLPLLLDSPNGLQDCYKISRILYKPQQNLILMGQSGVSKHEMVQLAAIINNVACFEIDAPTYGQPLQFAYNLRQILLQIAKMNRNSFVLINDQVLRDPIYFDYIYNYMSQLARHESFVLFDNQFFIDLAAIEAQHIKKMKKVTVPNEQILFKQAVARLQKNVHFVFLMSDLMTYKEIIQMFPQFEYLCEVIYMEDLTQQDYLEMTSSYLARSNVTEEFIGDDMQYSRSLIEVRNRVKTLLLKNYYSPNMLKFTVREENLVHGASEFVFDSVEKLNSNIFIDAKGYSVFDDDLQQVLLNTPLDVSVLNKHRFGVFIEVTKFLYDLLSMYLTSKKSYFETFLAKSKQFHKYFNSVKESKKGLHEDQNNHSFRVAMAMEKIKEIKKQLTEKERNIQKKNAEIQELQEELQLAEEEVETVILEKNWKLERTIDDLRTTNNQQFVNIATSINNLEDVDLQLIQLLNVIIHENATFQIKYNKNEAVSIFLQKDELIDLLDDRRQQNLSRPIFDLLHQFVSERVQVEFSSKPLIFMLYNFLLELYRKMNIKNTMANTFQQIRQIRNQIDANVFSINYAQQSIQIKNEELKMLTNRLNELEFSGNKLSRKIEEAELSYMRTDQIFLKIEKYSRRMELKLQSCNSRLLTILGDCILLACSVVFLGMFAAEEREQFRAQVIEYLQKVRNIQCNKIWTETSSSVSANPNKSMFLTVLKDLGLRELLQKHNLPGVLSNHQFSEALFCMLFAPSCPVICDPTGVMQDYVFEKLLANMDPQVISATDILGNEKLSQNFASNKPTIVIDVNSQITQSSGLTQPHCLFRSLSNTLYNGVDFDPKRLGQAKKIGSIGSYLSHSNSQNKRIPILSAAFEHISLYQAQVFQPRFDFILNQDYLQNATFICAAPSLAVENRNKLDNNRGIVKLRELLIERLVPSHYNFKHTKSQIQSLGKRLFKLERNYENAFLIASGETFKKLDEYTQLFETVDDLLNADDLKAKLVEDYKKANIKIKLVEEASDVIFQIYLTLKLVGKQTNTVTYSWSRFLLILDDIIQKLIENLKYEAIRQKGGKDTEGDNLSEIEIEIDNSFFKNRLVPTLHQVIVSSLDSNSVPLFNFFLSLRLAHTYKAITAAEHQFIVKFLVDLKGYKKWRDPNHQFIQISDTVDKTRHQNLRRELLRLYPDVARQVFDQIEKNLGQAFQYMDASIFIQKELKERYQLTQVQQLTFGFLCPDTEFKSKLTLFMYTQNMATFDFTEEISPLGEFLISGDFTCPITLKTAAGLNPVNLVTTLAHQYKRSLVVLRADPTYQNLKLKTSLFNLQLTDLINSQLQDYGTILQTASSAVDSESVRLNSNLRINQREIISKQLWLSVKQREVNLDEGKIFFQDKQQTEGGQTFSDSYQNPHIKQILEAANQGSWVLVCPVQFPLYFTKLNEKIEQLRRQGLINPQFRLIIDLQNYNQNEIPDSFIFSDSCTFNLTESNQDRLITLSDIWSKILNPVLLERLTSTDNSNSELKKIEYKGEGIQQQKHTQFMQVFSKESQDQHALNLFNKYIERSTIEFNNKLKSQRVQGLERMKADQSQQVLEQQISGEANETISKNDNEFVTAEQEQKIALELANLVAAGGQRLNIEDKQESGQNLSQFNDGDLLDQKIGKE